MRFDLPPNRRSSENIVTMINVVFLLLIFFLMTAHIAPSAPLEVETPISTSDQTNDGPATVYIDASGRIAFDGTFDEIALQAIQSSQGALIIHVDQGLEALQLISLLRTIDPSTKREISILTQGAK